MYYIKKIEELLKDFERDFTYKELTNDHFWGFIKDFYNVSDLNQLTKKQWKIIIKRLQMAQSDKTVKDNLIANVLKYEFTTDYYYDYATDNIDDALHLMSKNGYVLSKSKFEKMTKSNRFTEVLIAYGEMAKNMEEKRTKENLKPKLFVSDKVINNSTSKIKTCLLYTSPSPRD